MAELHHTASESHASTNQVRNLATRHKMADPEANAEDTFEFSNPAHTGEAGAEAASPFTADSAEHDGLADTVNKKSLPVCPLTWTPGPA